MGVVAPTWLMGFMCAAQIANPGPEVEQQEAVYQKDVASFLQQHCIGCHSGWVPAGDFEIGGFRKLENVFKFPEEWSFVRELVHYGEMPPSERLQPTLEARRAFLAWSEHNVGPPDWPEPKPGPGHPILRRLSRAEYRNSIQDLFGVAFAAEEVFPPDPAGHGFDNLGETQHVTAPWMESYIQAAESIAEEAVRLPAQKHPPVQDFSGNQLLSTGRGRANGEDFILVTNGGAGIRIEAERPGRYRLRTKACHGRLPRRHRPPVIRLERECTLFSARWVE